MAAGVFGGIALAASLFAVAPAVAGTPGVPTSTVKAGVAHSVRYCVSSYGPDSPVRVHDERTGATVTLHTNNRGSGCTDVAVGDCAGVGNERVDATGTGADGNPATSSASVGAVRVPGCAAAGQGALPSSTGGHDRGLSGAELVLLGVAGAAAVGLGAVGVVAVRRRRAAPAS